MRADKKGPTNYTKDSGDDDRIALIYYKYVNELYAWGQTFTHDRELIKDCIQDLFAALINDQEKLQSIRSMKVYLFVSFRNNLIRALKEKNGMSYHSDLSDDSYDAMRDHSPNRLERYEEHEMRQSKKKLLRNIFRTLSSRQRRIIFLRFYMKMDYNQICQVLSLNYQSARTLVYRSLQKMREAYTHTRVTR